MITTFSLTLPRYSAIAKSPLGDDTVASSNDLSSLLFLALLALWGDDIDEVRLVRNVPVHHHPAGTVIWRHFNRRLAAPFPLFSRTSHSFPSHSH